MSEEFKRKAILRRAERALGMTSQHRKAVQVAHEAFTDWRGKCRFCGEEIEGTLAEIRAHSCGQHPS